ncbi:cell surface/extracellular protein [Theileria orientalis]|uniref:Cell surface/extracellular protein n=1 Tax=Theileria orientalis TaxID=68886 RepID=A0A976QVY7_THEOR|nr:cell surface/extracellular protein [Theileria orientalis]
MAVSYSKICFLIILNLIFKSKALSQTLVTTPSPEPESTSTHSTFNPYLLNSLKNRLQTFGSVNLSGSDQIKPSSAPTLGSESPVTDSTEDVQSTEDVKSSEDVQSTEDVKSNEDAQANEFTEATDSPHSEVSEPKISEHKTSYLEELLTNRPEQRYTGAYQPREKEFSVSADFANFLSKQSRDMLKKCTKTPHEFVLIVDESGSISTYNWNTKVKDFVLLISSAVAEVNSYNKLSIIQYSRTPKLVMDSETIDKLSLNGIGKVIDDMFSAPRTHGTTYTGEALQFAREKILDKQGQFVLELSESTAPLSKKNKIVILLTDGGSKDPEKAHRESLIHRFNGVDLYVFGVGSFNEAECRKLVGCSPEGDCNYFFHAKWESIIDYLQKMVISMCRDTGRNATCLENWSEFSECSAKCGGGIMKAKLLNFTTVAEATVGEDGIKGLSCEEQYRNVSEKYERCNTFPCKDHLVNINQHSTHPKETRNEDTTDSRDSELKPAEQKPSDSLDGEEVGSMRTVQYRRKTPHEEGPTVEEPNDEEEETLEATPLEEDAEEETQPSTEETDDTPSSTREEMATPIRATRYTGTSEERNEKLNEILRNLEAHKESMRASTHHDTHPHPHTQTRHKPDETEHSHHHHTPEPTSHSEESRDTDGDGTDLTNLAGFDGTGRVPFHLISGKDHKEVKVEKVLDEEEEKQFEETEKEREKERERERELEKEREPSKPTNHIRGNEKVMRDQDSQTERREDEADETEDTEERAPRTRDSSTNTVNMVDAATNTLNTRDASTNTVNMSDAATNTVHTRDMEMNTEGRTESTGDNTQETIKKHVPKYKKPTDHRPHHTTDLKEVAQQAEMAISTTKMKFKRFLENEHVRKFAAVAIVIFLSGLSISVFSYIFLRGKEPTPHLFDPSDQEFMNAGDGDDVEPSENFQVSNMEDGIWA